MRLPLAGGEAKRAAGWRGTTRPDVRSRPVRGESPRSKIQPTGNRWIVLFRDPRVATPPSTVPPREPPHASVAFAVGTPHASLQHGTAEARLSPDTRRPDPAFGVFRLCTVAFGDVTEQLAIVFGVRRFSGCQGSWGPQENEGTETFSFYSNSLEKHHVVTCNKIEKNMVFLGISISHLCVLFHTSTCILYRNY